MANYFLGEIRLVAFNYAPHNWALCAGQVLSIAQNTALFSLLGTTYGGNGQTTFALPDLRSRVPISQGDGPGLGSYVLGEETGEESVALSVNEIASHSHGIKVANPSNSYIPTSKYPAITSQNLYDPNVSGTLNVASLASYGQSQAHSNRQPYLVLTYIISLAGIYPSQ